MIEASSAFATTTTRDDASFQNWNKTVRDTKARMTYHNNRTAGPIPSFGTMVHSNVPFTQSYAPADGSKPDIAYEAPAESGRGFGFLDVVDIINPLQHLPVIGTLYRKFTGDAIGPIASVIGGALFGGPVGAASSLANVAVKESTGRDVGENILAIAGFGSPLPEKKPDLNYDKPIAAGNVLQDLPGTTLAVTNLSMTRHGQKNFAATTPAVYSWNS